MAEQGINGLNWMVLDCPWCGDGFGVIKRYDLPVHERRAQQMQSVVLGLYRHIFIDRPDLISELLLVFARPQKRLRVRMIK